jgi:hypothetical protein
MASDLDSSSRGATLAASQPGSERASSPSSSGVREALRSFARDGARVVVLMGETNRQRFVVHPGAPAQRFRIGSSAECNWTVDAPGVAPLHLELHWDGGELFVTPLGGCTVLLNGATHRHRVRIMGDTHMHVGEAEVALWVGAEPRPEEQATPSRPPQAFHVARPPRLIDDASRTRTAMGMVSPLLAAWQAKNEAEAAARAASDGARPDRRTEPFYVGGLNPHDDGVGRVDRASTTPAPAPVVSVGGGGLSLFDTERTDPWPEPPIAEHEHDGAHLLAPAEAPPAKRLGRSLAVQTTAELALPPRSAMAPERLPSPLPAPEAMLTKAARPAPSEPHAEPVVARATPVPPWEDPAEIAPAALRQPPPSAAPLPTSPLPFVRAMRIPEDTRGTTMPAMRVMTSELTVVDPGSRVLTPAPHGPVATPRPAPREPSSRPPLGALPAAPTHAAPSVLPPAEPWGSHVPTGAAATQSVPMDTAWPLPPASVPPAAPPPAPAIHSQAQARFLDPLPAPQPERPLLATSAALRDRYLREREAEWETPSAAALERPRLSVLGQPQPAQGGPHSRLYWLGIVLALIGMSAAPLAIPELREDARELLRRGLRTVSSLVGNDAGLDRVLPPRPPRAPEITERVR